MSTRDREEIHWREMRRQWVAMWNRDGIEGSEANDDNDLQTCVRIPHHRKDVDKKNTRTVQRQARG